MKNLLDKWAVPDSPSERVQLTLRISQYDYDRVQALRERFPKRTANDLITGLISAGLDELEKVK